MLPILNSGLQNRYSPVQIRMPPPGKIKGLTPWVEPFFSARNFFIYQDFFIYGSAGDEGGERRCLTHVGAPVDRITRWISNVLTPQGNDMILVLGLEVSRRSPVYNLII